MDSNIGFVITTINKPTIGLKEILRNSKSKKFPFIVIGDKKTPDEEFSEYNYYSIEDQKRLNFRLTKILPENSYTRKMIGYLLLAKEQVSYIKETDDDNIPYENFYEFPRLNKSVRIYSNKELFINPYVFFTKDKIWPRGFPLTKIYSSFIEPPTKKSKTTFKYIEQGLADFDPDVDAIFRLINGIWGKKFDDALPVLVAKYNYTPFNSQCTSWPIELLPLMYLPVTCSFRLTDIWRSYIAQRLIKNLDFELIYNSSQVSQTRNYHDLLVDYEMELDSYLRANSFIDTLEQIELEEGYESLGSNLKLTYSVLIKNGYFAEEELNFLDAWLFDISRVS